MPPRKTKTVVKKAASKIAAAPKLKAQSLKSKKGFIYGLAVDNLAGHFLIFAVIASLLAMLFVLSRFVVAILIAAVVAIAFNPLHEKLVKSFGGRRALASLVSCLLVFLVIIVPFTLITILLGREAIDMYGLVNQKIDSGFFNDLLKWEEGGPIYELRLKLLPILDIQNIDIQSRLTEAANGLTDWLVGFVSGIIDFLIDFVVMMFSLYYFFKDGPKLQHRLAQLMPMPIEYERELFSKLTSMVYAIFYGLFLTALIQGAIGSVGLAIAGVPNAIFWGAMMSVAALLPVLGAGLVWFPAGVILLFLGQIGQGIFILLWGALLVSTIDNFIRPYLIGGKAHTYPLLTFLSVFGGFFAMGPKGILFGPMIMMLTITILYIYRLEYEGDLST